MAVALESAGAQVGRALVALGAAMSLGCSLSLPPPRVEAGTCTVLTDTPTTLSSALPAEHCRFRDTVSDQLEIAGPPIRYAMFESPSAAIAHCEPFTGRRRPGCAIDAEAAVAGVPFLVHEVAHNVLLANGLVGTSALQEGTAEMYGGSLYENPSISHDLPLDSITDEHTFQNLDGGYPRAASLVSFLLDTGGEASLVALLSRVSYGTPLADLDRVALDIYGRTMTELHAEWSALPDEPGYRVARPVYQCSSPPLDPATPLLHIVRGVASSIREGGAFRTFVADRDGELHVRASGVGPSVRVISCDRGPNVLSESSEREVDARAPIAAGRYAVWVTSTLLEGDVAEADIAFSLTLE